MKVYQVVSTKTGKENVVAEYAKKASALWLLKIIGSSARYCYIREAVR